MSYPRGVELDRPLRELPMASLLSFWWHSMWLEARDPGANSQGQQLRQHAQRSLYTRYNSV